MRSSVLIILLLGVFLLFAGCAGVGDTIFYPEKPTGAYDTRTTYISKTSIVPEAAGAEPLAEMAPTTSESLLIGQPLKTKEGTVSVKLERGQLESKLREATAIVESQGGAVVSILYDEYSGQKHYSITFSFDPQKFDNIFEQLKRLGELEGANVNVEDVTTEYRDIEIRLQNKNIELQRLYVLYNKSETVEDLLSVELEITRVETEIEQLKSEKLALEKRIQKSTLILDLYEDKAPSESLEGEMDIKIGEGKLENSLSSLKSIVESESGVIQSLNFVETQSDKTYSLTVKIDSVRLDPFMEKVRSVGEVSRFNKNINEENRPEKSLVYLTLVEKKPAIKTQLQIPLEELGSTFLIALSAALLLLSGLIGFLLPGAVLALVGYWLYKRWKRAPASATKK